jgi:predicted ArsR family transcriptional regulator
MIRTTPSTADEVAAALEISVLHARPRISELRALGKVQDSGERRKNDSGHKAIVWKATACDENATTSAFPSA